MKKQTRIVAGKYKNAILHASELSRPLTQRVKISLFDILQDFVRGKKVLDMFAGSGSFGIEAISRGAESVVFVDANSEVTDVLRMNLNSILDQSDVDKATVHQQTFDKFVKEKEHHNTFDLVFVDPPFKISAYIRYHKLLKVLKNNAIIAIRLPKEIDINQLSIPQKSFKKLRDETYGVNKVYFFQKIALKPEKKT